MDKIDEAIAKTAETVRMAGITYGLMGDGARPFTIAMPDDVSDFEMLAAMDCLLRFMSQIREHRDDAPKLVAVHGTLVS